MTMRYLSLLAIAVACAPAPALAQKLLYSNNFDTENNGVTKLGINSITGFSTPDFGIQPPPTVDLVHTNDGYGITCAGLSGGCLDLDGDTNSPGLLYSDATYAFAPGDQFVLRYSISGSQRAGFGTDGYHLGFVFDGLTTFDYRFQSSNGRDESGTLTNYDFTLNKDRTPYDFPFVDITLTFTPRTSGSFFIGIDGYSGSLDDDGNPVDSDGDNVGMILDNLSLTQGAVPEPATWATMIAGLGAVGFALRRRRGAGALRTA